MILAVALGGALGATARYLIATRVYSALGVEFPYGTLAVNVTGCLLLGVVFGLVEERDAFTPNTRAFMTIGILGGMTTFSTFIYEGYQLTRDGELFKTGAYAVLSVGVGFLAFALARGGVTMLNE